MTSAERERLDLHTAIDNLSDGSLHELRSFVEFLHFKEQQKTDWFSRAYDLFAPVRQGILEAGVSEEEVDRAIDEAIAEVRSERKASGRP